MLTEPKWKLISTQLMVRKFKLHTNVINAHITDITENEKVDKHPKKIYRVAFLGSDAVGKTSIIDQFMSSEHADVYEDIQEEIVVENEVTGRYLASTIIICFKIILPTSGS